MFALHSNEFNKESDFHISSSLSWILIMVNVQNTGASEFMIETYIIPIG